MNTMMVSTSFSNEGRRVMRKSMRTSMVATALGAVLLGGLLLASPSAFAIPTTLLAEDFNDVTGLPAANRTRTVTHILANNPAQLPAGTTWSAPSANALNVRRADNAINTMAINTAPVPSGFGSAFSSQFLVFGDNAGPIGGAPSTGLTRVLFPFTLPAHLAANPVTIAYNFAFRGFDTGVGTDFFRARLLGPTPLTFQVLPSPTGFSSGLFSDDFTLAAGNYRLVFEVAEHRSGRTNTAAGVDNIHVFATVPEPATILLLGSGLMGLAAWRRVKRQA